LGVKGVGEAGHHRATPAIVAAVVDAMSPWASAIFDMPIKPEALWRIIHQNQKRQALRKSGRTHDSTQFEYVAQKSR